MRLQQEKEAEQKRLGQEWQLKLQHLQLQTEQLKKADVKEQEMRDFMIKQEQSRRQHEMELLEKQLEMEKMRTEQNRRNRRVEKMEPWRDADKPEAYLFKFERVMKEAAIPSEEWASRLIPLLTGKALTAYSNHVSVTATSDYETLKTALHGITTDNPQTPLRRLPSTLNPFFDVYYSSARLQRITFESFNWDAFFPSTLQRWQNLYNYGHQRREWRRLTLSMTTWRTDNTGGTRGSSNGAAGPSTAARTAFAMRDEGPNLRTANQFPMVSTISMGMGKRTWQATPQTIGPQTIGRMDLFQPVLHVAKKGINALIALTRLGELVPVQSTSP